MTADVIGARGATSVGIASLTAAGSGYVVLVAAARYLDPAANADFLVFWSLLFGLFGVLGGVQQESTRAVGTVTVAGAPRGRAARILPWCFASGGAVAVLVALTSPWWRPSVLRSQPVVVVVVLVVAAVAYAGHLMLAGSLAGRRQWTVLSVLIGGEAVLRLLAVAGAVLLSADVVGIEVAAASTVLFWLVVVAVSGRARRAAGARGDDGRRRLVARLLQAILASTGTAALVVGFPSIMRATTDAETWAGAAPLVLAISLTRAPLLIPLQAYQGVAIGYFLDPTRKRATALLRVIGIIIAVGAVGAVLAYLVGPTLMAAFFGPAYRTSGALLAGLTLASSVLAVLTMTGSGVVALGRHAAYAAGWLLATAVSVGILLVDAPLAERAVASLIIGPVVGVTVHLFVLRRISLPAVQPAQPAAPAAGL